MKKYKVTFYKSVTIYAYNKESAIEGACGEVEDFIIQRKADARKYLNAKVWEEEQRQK